MSMPNLARGMMRGMTQRTTLMSSRATTASLSQLQQQARSFGGSGGGYDPNKWSWSAAGTRWEHSPFRFWDLDGTGKESWGDMRPKYNSPHQYPINDIRGVKLNHPLYRIAGDGLWTIGWLWVFFMGWNKWDDKHGEYGFLQEHKEHVHAYGVKDAHNH